MVSPMRGSATCGTPADGTDEQVSYTVRRAAELLDVSERLLWNLIKEREIPTIKIGRARRILRKDLLAFAELRRVA